MKFVLAIDTTSPYCSIAVLEGEKLISEYNFNSRFELSEVLTDRIDFVLSSLGLSLKNMNILGVSNGPGFFTGIRVALATLKGLFFGNEIPVVAVSSLYAAAAKIMQRGGTVVPVTDARREEVYTAAYTVNDGRLSEEVPPSLVRIDEIRPLLPFEGEIFFTGNGILAYPEQLKNMFPEAVFVQSSPYIAAETGLIALREFDQGNYLSGMSGVEPLYIRVPDAEKNHDHGSD